MPSSFFFKQKINKMTVVNKFQISPDMKTLSVKVTGSSIGSISSFLLETDETYLDTNIDLTSKLSTVSPISEFDITSEELNIGSFNGIYFGNFTSLIDDDVTVAACNLSQFFYAINDELSSVNGDCISCNDNLDNALLMDLYLEGLENALIASKYTNAIDNLYALRRLCGGRVDNCMSGCTSGYGILDGAFVVI